MSATELASAAIVAALLGASIYTDLRYAKILNRFTLPCLPLGLAMWGLGAGWEGTLFSLEGMAVGAIALVAAGVFRLLAPGDAKLILAIGALEGPGFVGSTMIFGAVAGGVMALVMLLRKHLLRQWATGLAVAAQTSLPLSEMWFERAGFMPYSVAIACGALAAVIRPLW